MERRVSSLWWREWVQAVLWTGTWYVLGRAGQALCQEFLVYTPNSSEHPRGMGEGEVTGWMGGWVSCQ